ncbi:hypothetical protein N665_0189s0049 [Sinapis alba]|nr:hypothetical protein N665_0189s0049 [Sinapis alba]
MKNITLILAMILFSNCVTSKVTLSELKSSTNEELHSLFHPKKNWPFHVPRKTFPRIPAGHFRPNPFHPQPEVIKCLSGKKKVRTCFYDLVTRKADIGSECCAVIKKMKEDCEKTVVGSFHNPIWTGYVKLHCSNVVGSASPAPSLAPSPAEGF